MRHHLLSFFLTFCCLCSLRSNAQNDSLVHDSSEVKVFILCQWCYEDFLRTHITFVNFVRDRFDAEVQLVITSLSTGSGGNEFSVGFIGKNRFEGLNDTLFFTSNGINTDDEVRRGLANIVRMGLMRYVARTPQASSIVIHSADQDDEDEEGIGKNPADDPWKAWVFRTNVNGEFEGQLVSKSRSVNGSFNASRTTEKMKFYVNVTSNYSDQRFDYQGQRSEFVLRSNNVQSMYVHSIGKHWSAGAIASTGRSDFSNFANNTNAWAAVEFDVFPYKAAQTKMITLTYAAGYNFLAFQDTTIFDRMRQQIPVHRLNAGAQFTQKWGSLSAGAYASQFLSDASKYRYGGWINFDIRLLRGFSVNSYMSYDAIHDQINLRKDGASSDEVLLAQRELATDFTFYVWFGLNYRFGSIYNNVVNPRFNYAGF